MSTELFTNFATTTLNGTINNSTTTVVVTSASSFPSTGNFRILIDHEIMVVTARSGNTFTVTRGAESSTAASHTTGVLVSHILTAGGFTQTISEHQGSPGYLPSAVPSLGVFTSADFGQVNTSGKTIVDSTGKITVRLPAATGGAWDVLVLTRPRTTTATLCFTMSTVGTGSFSESAVGLGLANTGENVFQSYQVNLLGSFGYCTNSYSWTDPTTSSGPIQGQVGCGVSDIWWLKMHDEGAPFGDFVFSLSNDGIHYIEALRRFRGSSSLFASPPPDKWAITIHNHQNTGQELVVNILGWTE